jgi:hypothetical protein
MKKILLTLMTAAFALPASAMFCPTGYNQINMGDTISQVQAACGLPATTNTVDDTANKPQEWTYYVKSQPSDQATLRMTVAFTQNGVTNMSVNGIGVTNTQICAGNTVQLAMTEDQVKTACGAPAFITQSNLPVNAKDTTQVTELVYTATPQNVTLTFENGILKSRK